VDDQIRDGLLRCDVRAAKWAKVGLAGVGEGFSRYGIRRGILVEVRRERLVLGGPSGHKGDVSCGVTYIKQLELGCHGRGHLGLEVVSKVAVVKEVRHEQEGDRVRGRWRQLLRFSTSRASEMESCCHNWVRPLRNQAGSETG
jgi:hypothetical protein